MTKPKSASKADEKSKAPRPTALVTGAGTGIGRAIAVGLARDGFQVLITGRRLELLQGTAHEIESAGGLAALYSADLSDRAATDALADWAAQGDKPLTVLVHNAAIGGPSPLTDPDLATFDRQMAVNLTAPMRLTRRLLPSIPRDGSGRIVMIGSVLARFGIPEYHGYCASKAGLVGFTRALSRDLARERITVNAVCPGWVTTEMSEASFSRLATQMGCDVREAQRRMMENVPLGRALEPDEVAGYVRYLVSPLAAGITGQAMNIDCGVMA